jgi:hypothetical protein
MQANEIPAQKADADLVPCKSGNWRNSLFVKVREISALEYA